MATKNYSRRVIGEENLVGGWSIKSCQARLWLSIFMLLLSPAISPKHGLQSGLVQPCNNWRSTEGLTAPPRTQLSHWAEQEVSLSIPDGPLAANKRLSISINPSLSFFCISLLHEEKLHSLWPCSLNSVHCSLCESLSNWSVN